MSFIVDLPPEVHGELKKLSHITLPSGANTPAILTHSSGTVLHFKPLPGNKAEATVVHNPTGAAESLIEAEVKKDIGILLSLANKGVDSVVNEAKKI